MNQLDPVGVQHREEGWVGQKRQRILGVVTQQALEARAFGQLGKEGPIIGVQPTIKGTKAPAFERRQQANRYQGGTSATIAGAAGSVASAVKHSGWRALVTTAMCAFEDQLTHLIYPEGSSQLCLIHQPIG
jgi:hypothetical protein